MTAFAKHGIQHLSPSSLNCWRESPGVWALRYLANVKDEGNAAMWRGSAVENGLAAFLHGASPLLSIEAALQAFDLNAQGEITDEITAERELIAPMVEQCTQWEAPGELFATQLKVEHWFEGIPIPVIGYLDFAFERTDTELKSTKALPSKARPNHVRQVAVYSTARGKPCGILYVTAKKRAYFDIDNDATERALNDLHADALSLMGFLSRVGSARDALRCLPMDTDNYRFSPKAKVALGEILAAG